MGKAKKGFKTAHRKGITPPRGRGPVYNSLPRILYEFTNKKTHEVVNG